MSSLASHLVPPLLRALGYRRRFASVDKTSKLIADRQLRPQPYGPPRRALRGVSITVDHDRGWPLYTVVPAETSPQQHIVYVHGGAWINQIAPQHWQLVAELTTATSSQILVPIYPLAPHGTAASVVPRIAELLRNLCEKHGANNVSVVGDSAGGQIALSAALLLRDDQVALAHTVLIAPALDLSLSNPEIDAVEPDDPWLVRPGLHTAVDLWRDGLSLTNPMVSPLCGDMSGLGPLTVFVGTRDITNPDAKLLVAKARAAGVPTEFHEAPNMVHVYPLLPIPEGRQARARMSALLRGEPVEEATAERPKSIG